MLVERNPDGSETELDGSVALPKEEHDKLVEELAQKNQSLANLVSEVKELREKKQLTEAEKTALETKLKELNDLKDIKPEELTAQKIDSIINERLEHTLSKKDQEERNSNRLLAQEKFKQINKEFAESNDPGGLKFAALQKKLSMFNLDSQKTIEDYLDVFNSANMLLKQPLKDTTIANPYSATRMSETVIIPSTDDKVNLSDVEKRIVEKTFDGDAERYLAIKAKRPDYIETLLRYAR